MPYKDPEKQREYQRDWMAKRAAEKPLTEQEKKDRRTVKALWRAKKGKAYFRRKYRDWIAQLSEEGRLEEYRRRHATVTKDWRSRVFLEVLEEVRRKANPPPPPAPPELGYTGRLTLQ